MVSGITTGSILEKARRLQDQIVETRRFLHQHPELGFNEHSTAQFVAKQLKAAGYNVTSVAETGVVAKRGEGEGPTIAIRADMDGLPINEENEVPYRSKNPGVMHACGHDAHTSCALAAAQILAQENLSGQVRFLMQPAEEVSDENGFSGARRMIQDGAMQGVDAVIGLHTDASLPAGKIGIAVGAVMAAANSFELTILGKGGHGAFPENAIDSVVLAANVIQQIQQIVSRRISAVEPALITIGSVHSDSTAGNVISPSVNLSGTVRSFSKDTRLRLIKEIENVCSTVRAVGGDYRITWAEGYPVTYNDPAVVEIMRSAAVDLIGADNVVAVPPKPWSEDFSMLSEVAPGAFMFLGAEIAGDHRAHHTATFDIDESGLYLGTAILARNCSAAHAPMIEADMIHTLHAQVEEFFDLKQPSPGTLAVVEQVIAGLDDGSITVVEKEGEGWRVNTWVKKAILLYFRLRPVEKMQGGAFYDKVPLKEFAQQTNRIVPYSSIRHGAYVAPGVVVMAPSFINIGAYVDTGSMIDSLVLVGSCARIGKNVHIGAGTIIGGVLEPPNSRPVIVEDNAFIGGNCGLYEGCIVKSGAVIAAGTVITTGTPVIDVESGREYRDEVPENAVVVPGGRLRTTTGNQQDGSPAQQFVLQTPLIIKYRDPAISTKLALEESLRSL